MEGRQSRGNIGHIRNPRGPCVESYVQGALPGHGENSAGHSHDLQHGWEKNITNSGTAEQENVESTNRQPLDQRGLRYSKRDKKPISLVNIRGPLASISTSGAPTSSRSPSGCRPEDESESRADRSTPEIFGNETYEVAQQDGEAPNIHTPILTSHIEEPVPVTTAPVMLSNDAPKQDINEAIKVLETGVKNLNTTIDRLQKIQRRLGEQDLQSTAASPTSAPETALSQNPIDEDNPPLQTTILDSNVDLSHPTPSGPKRPVLDLSARQIAKAVKKGRNDPTDVQGLPQSRWAPKQGDDDVPESNMANLEENSVSPS